MTTKITPGQWEYDLLDCLVFDSRGIRIADFNNEEEVIPFEQQEANSIAAAAIPEMMEALRICATAATKDQFEQGKKLAYAAIAKAEGRA